MTTVAALNRNPVVSVTQANTLRPAEVSPRTFHSADQVEESTPTAPSDRVTLSGDAKTRQEIQEIEKLKKRDAEVRAHEQAHLSALGAHRSGGPKFTFQTGPDGNRYAVGGEVPVDVSKEETPEQTIRKAQAIRRAALAPADPSGADRSVAAQASQLEAEARAEMANEQQKVVMSESKISRRASNYNQNTAPLNCATCGQTYTANDDHYHLSKMA